MSLKAFDVRFIFTKYPFNRGKVIIMIKQLSEKTKILPRRIYNYCLAHAKELCDQSLDLPVTILKSITDLRSVRLVPIKTSEYWFTRKK